MLPNETGTAGLDRPAVLAQNNVMADPTFTPEQFREAQQRLGLSDSAFALVLGLSSADQVRRLKVANVNAASHRPVRPYIARLVQAYLDGYRPADWPGSD